MRTCLRLITCLLSLPALAQTSAPSLAPSVACILEKAPEQADTSPLPYDRIAARIQATLSQGGLRLTKLADEPQAQRLRIFPDVMVRPDGTCVLAIKGAVEPRVGQPIQKAWVAAYRSRSELDAEAPDVAARMAWILERELDKSRPAEAEFVPKLHAPGAIALDFAKMKVALQPRMPPYPPLAKAGKVQGTVVAIIHADAEGVPQKVVLESGPAELAVHSLLYLLRWRFEAPKEDGGPYPVIFQMKLVYRLQ